MRGISKSPPKYRLHRKSGQAVVTIAGKDHYLGRFNSSESRKKYDRVIVEWIQAGRPTRTIEAEAETGLAVSTLLVLFLRHANTFYGDSKEPENFKIAMGPLKQLYSRISANDFSTQKTQERPRRNGQTRLGSLTRQSASRQDPADLSLGCQRGARRRIGSACAAIHEGADALSSQTLLEDRNRLVKKHLRHIVGFGTVIRRADKAAFLEDFEKLAQRVEEFKKKVATALNAKLNERRHP